MMAFIAKSKHRNNQGDTIVEVVISIAILAFALGGAYVLSNKALNTAVESNQRTEASAIMQGQIELLRSAYKASPATFAANYKPTTFDFCLKNGLTLPLTHADDPTCRSVDSSQYSALIHWDSSSNNDYAITIFWNNINGHGPSVTVNGTSVPQQSTLTAYYRTPN